MAKLIKTAFLSALVFASPHVAWSDPAGSDPGEPIPADSEVFEGSGNRPHNGMFSSVYVVGELVVATFPTEGVRFHIWRNGADLGVSEYGQQLRLRGGDYVRLSDRHWTCQVRAKIDPDFKGLAGTCNGEGDKNSQELVLRADHVFKK